jgi:hypothetical protein
MQSIWDVVAHWTYSEVVGANKSDHYNGRPGVEALRAKRTDGIPFAELSAKERTTLAQLWVQVRGSMILYLDGLTRFRKIDLTRRELGELYVFPAASHDLIGKLETFAKFMDLPRNDTGDCRGETRTYRECADPLTLGHSQDKQVLIDGYHRAVSFWRHAPKTAVIAAYAPVDGK